MYLLIKLLRLFSCLYLYGHIAFLILEQLELLQLLFLFFSQHLSLCWLLLWCNLLLDIIQLTH